MIPLFNLRRRPKAAQVAVRIVRGILKWFQASKIYRFNATGFAGEVFKNGEFFQHWGFASQPQTEAELILIALGASGGNVICIASADKRYPCPVEIKPGETCVYNQFGHYIHLANDKLVINSPLVIYKTNEIIREPYVEP